MSLDGQTPKTEETTAPAQQKPGVPEKQDKPHKPDKKTLARRRWRLAGLIAIALVIAIVGGAVMLYARASTIIQGEDTPAGVLPPRVKTQSIPAYTGKGIICGLICGIAYNDENDVDGNTEPDTIGNTDMILYLMYDTVNNKANILQIPRDVYVGGELATEGTGKINGLYHGAEDPDNRMDPLAQCLMDQLALPVDFYLALDVAAVKALVDHKGTIEMYIPRDLVDKDDPTNIIPEGPRHVTGEEIEFILRNRNFLDGDLTRVLVQRNFYSALFREMKTLAPADLVMWMRILLYYMNVGGIDILQIGGLAQEALSLTAEDLTFVRPPTYGTRYTAPNGKPTDLVYLDPQGTADLLNEYFRPEGAEKSVDELDIHTLPDAYYGFSEAQISTMSSIQQEEDAGAEADAVSAPSEAA